MKQKERTYIYLLGENVVVTTQKIYIDSIHNPEYIYIYVSM